MLFNLKPRKTKENKISENYITLAKEIFLDSHSILVGAGAGLSASGGLNYFDAGIVERWFPSYFAKGVRSLPELQSIYWHIEDSDPQLYWGVWAKHIWHVRYQYQVTEPYRKLHQLLEGKNAFIITTNADGQFEKAGFSKKMIFSPQGNYDQFQCSRPCSDESYSNESQISIMINGLYHTRCGTPLVRIEDIPRCPQCGSLLKPNLRCDNTFVEKSHMINSRSYHDFLQKSFEDQTPTLLLELGVGFNTPGVIRYPFDKLVKQYQQFKLIIVNIDAAHVPDAGIDKALGFNVDINDFLDRLL